VSSGYNGTSVSDRLERIQRLADKVQRDCRSSEDLLDNVERKLNEVIYFCHPTVAVSITCGNLVSIENRLVKQNLRGKCGVCSKDSS